MKNGYACLFFIIVDCENGEMRLMEGKEEWQGRLEVCYNRRWGTVSGDNWTLTNSHVVCNALGYNTTSKTFLQLQNDNFTNLQSYLLPSLVHFKKSSYKSSLQCFATFCDSYIIFCSAHSVFRQMRGLTNPLLGPHQNHSTTMMCGAQREI